LQSEIIGFDFLKELYEKYADFKAISKKCSMKQLTQDYHIMEGFLLKENLLGIPRTSLRDELI